jgi:hypothetical protein
VEKAYLQGRFDAIPYIDDSSDNLKTLIQWDKKDNRKEKKSARPFLF